MNTHSRDLFETKEYKIKHQPILIIDHPRNPKNLGSVIRLAANVDALKVIVVDEAPDFKDQFIRKTAASSYGKVEHIFVHPNDLMKHIPDDYALCAIETSEKSENIYQTKLPEKIALMVGNERFGIEDQTLEKCEQHLYIPMYGITQSMNVTHALAVSLFEWLRQIHY